MGSVTTALRGGPLTRAELDALPADGRRRELVDGSLLVTPAPGWAHQSMLLELAVLLRQRCPADLTVLVAPFDVVLAADTIVQPDVLVARRADLTERDLPVPPLLAVEVLSPSTRDIDLTLKRRRYQRAGCPSYWVLDPGAASTAGTAGTAGAAPRLIAWELRGGHYTQVADVTGEQAFTTSRPFAVTLTPATLAR